MKRILRNAICGVVMFMVLTFIFGLAVDVSAAEVIAGGTCGEDAYWELASDGILTVSGSGETGKYDTSANKSPWSAYRSQIKEIVIGSEITKIGEYAFYSCSAAEKVTIGDSVYRIDFGAFSGCNSLKEISFGSGLKILWTGAFSQCINLKTVILPEGLELIAAYAFNGCSDLHNVYIPASIQKISRDAFLACPYITHVTYGGTPEQWATIELGSKDEDFSSLRDFHYNAPRAIYHLQNCENIGYFCDVCNLFLTKELKESGTHTYENDTDRYCDECGFTRTVTTISVSTKPSVLKYPMIIGVLDATGGVLQVTFTDGSIIYTDMTDDMLSGLDNLKYGRQTATVTYEGKTATYAIETYPATTPDRLEIKTLPENVIYKTGDKISLNGLSLTAFYGAEAVPLTYEQVALDPVDMTTSGVKLASVRFYDAAATFRIYVHGLRDVLVDSSLYPESPHNYPNNSNTTQTFTYPGAEKLIITFSEQCEVENSWDKLYIMDGKGYNITSVITGGFGGKTYVVPGDTVKIRLTSDSSVGKYGYSFSSIYAQVLEHEGAVCEICGLITAQSGEKVALTENINVFDLKVPAGVTLDLNGYTLTAESLASFGDIIDTVGGGCLQTSSFVLTENSYLPVYDADDGGYHFYDYQVQNLGVREAGEKVTFGFTLRFSDASAYALLAENDDTQITAAMNLAWDDVDLPFNFGGELIRQYAALQLKYPSLNAAMQLTVTGLHTLEEGTVLAATPAITAVNSQLNKTFEPMYFEA